MSDSKEVPETASNQAMNQHLENPSGDQDVVSLQKPLNSPIQGCRGHFSPTTESESCVCPRCEGTGLEITSETVPHTKIPLVYVSDCPSCEGEGR